MSLAPVFSPGLQPWLLFSVALSNPFSPMSRSESPRSFQATRWSLVRAAAGRENTAEARQALAELCEICWYPVYAFIRRSGHAPHDAEDLTQGFFAGLLEKDILAAADPARGRLRTFLLTCVRNHLHHEHERSIAAKRNVRLLTSFDAADAEERYLREPADDLTPDRLYQRRWALTLLGTTLDVLEHEFQEAGKSALFDALRPYLGFGVSSEESYDDTAAKLGMPVGTLKNHVFRLRQRWRELLFEQVSATLVDPTSDEIKAELSELMECL
jgi:RNA polymerase sigma-70 factor (ECF subfamily)